jgi:hypothetical protein
MALTTPEEHTNEFAGIDSLEGSLLITNESTQDPSRFRLVMLVNAVLSARYNTESQDSNVCQLESNRIMYRNMV